MFDEKYYRKTALLIQEELVFKLEEYLDLYKAQELVLERTNFEFMADMYFILLSKVRYDSELLDFDVCKDYIKQCKLLMGNKRYSMWKVIKQYLDEILKNLKEIDNFAPDKKDLLGINKVGEITLGSNVIIGDLHCDSEQDSVTNIEVTPGDYDVQLVRVNGYEKGILTKQVILLKKDHTESVTIETHPKTLFSANKRFTIVDENYYINNKDNLYKEMCSLSSTANMDELRALLKTYTFTFNNINIPVIIEVYKDKKDNTKVVGLGLVLNLEDNEDNEEDKHYSDKDWIYPN